MFITCKCCRFHCLFLVHRHLVQRISLCGHVFAGCLILRPCVFQFIVRARDQSYPERVDTANVQINIIRDQFAPVFSLQDYRVTIPETLQVNSSTAFITVTATDQDLQVTQHVLVS